MTRNFRTTYYKTLGVPVVQHVVDVEASYHALFDESVVNLEQLRKLALEVGIPSVYRPLAWKLLCGVLPSQQSLWEFAEQERQHMYEDVVDAAAVLQLPERVEITVGHGTDEEMVHEEAASSQQAMIELYVTYRYEIHRQKRLRLVKDLDALKRVVVVLQAVLEANEMEQFWCLVRIVDLLDETVDVVDHAALFLDSTYEISAVQLEGHFIRALDHHKSAHRP
ncbi:hypothetical protein Poli38472_006136 [Pythium oligandrum]|uniref:TBC1 domain family member 7 n=1 Tax=Pythium oligandrum TaxID=41045 RepID=A0A8K1FSL3_PYTOL|nr:hypothetical protein Poli38472_006136 [Pythium oligandrum]|eukprot:TMW68668.1 hypothetical protein Poli38472_006136 [Pythium oligandrum]